MLIEACLSRFTLSLSSSFHLAFLYESFSSVKSNCRWRETESLPPDPCLTCPCPEKACCHVHVQVVQQCHLSHPPFFIGGSVKGQGGKWEGVGRGAWLVGRGKIVCSGRDREGGKVLHVK